MSDEATRANPYVGLRPFFKADSLYFFGRDAQIEELLAILRNNRFVGVVGSSGSGKSSLVRAGLVPALLGGFLVHDRDAWRRVTIKPGDAPIANLAAGLVAAMSPNPDAEAVAGSPEAQSLEAAIRAGHAEAVLDYIRPRLEANANLFMLVDQFEEIFAFRGSEDDEALAELDQSRRQEHARRKQEASDFVDLMLALVSQHALPIYVVLTMRTDFLGDCDLFYGLPEALNKGRYLVPRLTREQLRDAVECPALLAGAEVAPRLLDHVLNALGDRFDRLPVLQHALMRTFDAWRAAGATGPIDLVHFDTAGGLENALDRDAERALVGLDAAAVEKVFKRLTDTDSNGRRIRSPARFSELAAAAGIDRAKVEAIAARFEGEGRSFVHPAPDGRPEDPRLDISHESLIRQWVRLRDWVDAERKARDSYLGLVERAARYSKDEAAALSGPELRLARNWKKQVQPTAGWAARYARGADDFKDAMRYLSRSIWRVRIGRVIVFGATVGTVIMLTLSWLAASDTIDTATEQNGALVASVYRKLEPIDGTEDARRELLDRSVKLNRELTGNDENESNYFWSKIIEGDAIEKAAWDNYYSDEPATEAEGDRRSAALSAASNRAAMAYRDAARHANQLAIEDPDALIWYENLGTALAKYAETGDIAHTPPAYIAFIEVNKYLIARDPKNVSYRVGLANAYLKPAYWFESEDPVVSRQSYELAEAAATQALRLAPGSIEAMTAYIDAGTGLWPLLDPRTESARRDALGKQLIAQAVRRKKADPKNSYWNEDLNSIFNLLGLEAPHDGAAAARSRGPKAG